MGAIGLLIIGAVLVIVAYYLTAPPPAKTICNIVGWCCIAVGLILLLAALLGVPLTLGRV